MINRGKIRPWMLKKEIVILYYGFRDNRTPAIAKLPAILSLIYLLSPIDLIPDFIPFIGYLDDLIIVPLLINLSIRLLPSGVREESILKAEKNQKRVRWIFIVVVTLVVCLLAGLFFLIHRSINK
jgi:uncharacterized membrane protein YkvA (DUF1232 family)